MADSEKPKPPESPTTARELDFDDDEEPSTASPKPKTPGAASTATPAQDASKASTGGDEAAPPQPPRPLSPRQQAETTLKEAFPSIDASVVKAVLMASGGQVEPAFNALLGMSDPNAAQHEDAPPPPPPPRPQQREPQGRSQVEQDEIYARQLAEHYQSQEARRQYAHQRGEDPRHAQSPNQMGYYDDDEDRERSFIDDDLPVIRDNIRKGFLETQSKVNSFITNLRKKIDGEEEDDEPPPQPPRRPTQQAGRSSDTGRRSGDHARYDADPHVLGDDFTELQLRDETIAPKPGGRPHANPDLFKPTPATPGSGGERRVSFQDGPPETIDDTLYRGSPNPSKQTPSNGNKSKWQPLESVDPDPVAEHDPFSLGDSDDDEPKKKDPKPEDAERLQKATAEAMAEDIGSEGKDSAAAKAD